MSFEPIEKPLADAELEMVVGVIRRGLAEGKRIEELEAKIARLIAAIQEAKKRLKNLERIGQEVCRSYRGAIDPQRKQGLSVAEAIDRMKWIQEKSMELKSQLD